MMSINKNFRINRMKLSRNHNTIIKYEYGDGFRTLALKGLTKSQDSLVVTSKTLGYVYYNVWNKKIITPCGVNKFVESEKYNHIKLIFIDCPLLSTTSKNHKALIKLCTGKQIIFIGMDYKNLFSAMELMSVTKNTTLKTIVFNQYLLYRYG